jgi:hypothetical protein
MSRRRAVDLRMTGFFGPVLAGLGAFLFETCFFAAGFVFATFFLLAGFLADGFFVAARFLLACRLAADFLAIALLVATFFFLADFFAAGFFRATAFFVDDFLADTFRVVTLRFFPAVFFRADGVRLAAFFRAELAVFFAGISTSSRSQKNAQLYIACIYMEARISRFFTGLF